MLPLEKKIDKKNITKVILAKFGCLLILPKKIEDIGAETFIEKIKSCLNNEVAVSKVSELKVGERGYSLEYRKSVETGEKADFLALTPYLSFRVNLPVKNQRIAAAYLLYKSISHYVSSFDVVYNGSFFCVLRDADLSKVFFPGAPDVRDFLATTLLKEKLWNVEPIGPTPLREDIFLVFLKENKDTKEHIGGSIVGEGGSIYRFYSEKWLKKPELIKELVFLEAATYLEAFYMARQSHQNLADNADELLSVHEAINSVVERYEQSSFFRLREHYELSKTLEKLVGKHYRHLLNYSNGILRLRQEREAAKETLKKSPFDIILNRFMDELKFEGLDLDTFDKCANYAKEFTQRSYTTKVTLIGALIAILGTVFGTIILHVLGI